MASDSTRGMAAESSPIATKARACLQLFKRLSDLFTPRDVPIHGITRMQMLDHYGQLRVWASNIGALQLRHTASSLDYRLREAPKFSAEVVFLLTDLAETLEDVHAIASCERENRSGSPILSQLEKPNDGCGDSPGASDSSQALLIGVVEHDVEIRGALEPVSEIQELFQSIPETISRLFRLSVLIRNNSSRDRYAKAVTAGSKAPVDPSYDIYHVQNKFPRLRQKEMEWLGTRLGKAITQRRQYLWYCRDHREKMAKVAETTAPATQEAQDAGAKTQRTMPLLNVHGKQPLEATDDARSQVPKQSSTLAPTTASTAIPSRLERDDILERLDEEPDDEDNRSVTSYASSFRENEEDNRLSVIQFEEVATPNVPFECPYCWTIQIFNGHHSWKKHVMGDLKPYVCTAKACDMKLFADARIWFTHELQNHLVEWLCCFCSRAPFATQDIFQSHVVECHGTGLGEHQLATLSKTCQKPLGQLLPSACRICDTWEGTLRGLNKHISPDEVLAVTPQQFRHHVRGHMEQLALFAIPRDYREDEDGESGKAAQGGLSNTCSNRSLPTSIDSSEYAVHDIAGRFDAQRMTLLLDRRGDEISITEEVVKAAAGNEGHGKEVMALLLDRRGGEVSITEEIVKAAAGNEGNGKEVIELLLDRRGGEVSITEEVVKAAAGNKGNGKEVIELLLKRRGDQIAGNGRNSKRVMALLLDRLGDETDDHPSTLGCIVNLGLLLGSQGKYDEAEAMHREALEQYKKVLGFNHPDTIRYMINLGSILEDQGKYDEAEPMYREVIEQYERVRGFDHPDAIMCISKLGVLLKRQGKYDEAEAIYREALKQYEIVLGLDHPDTIKCQSNLRFLRQRRGK